MATETVLVTGASAGIGLELAKLVAADGSDLVLVARRKHELDQLAGELSQQHGVEARVIPADLADPAAPASIFEELSANRIQIDVLVNNAGFGAEGKFAELPLARQMNMVEVNVTALTHLTRLFLPPMLKQGRGGVLNVGSTAGFQPGPYMAVYYATKAYVLSFTEALAEEVAGTGVKVTCLAPGPTRTEFFAQADMKDSPLLKLGPMDARTVAEVGYRGFRAGKPIVVPGVRNKIGAFSVRFTPRYVVRKITARLNRSH
jgi:short-subunit dehydrogenase